jgi:hypothetical protein
MYDREVGVAGFGDVRLSRFAQQARAGGNVQKAEGQRTVNVSYMEEVRTSHEYAHEQHVQDA